MGGGVTFTTTDLNIALLSIPPGAIQEGSANLIDTNDARLLDAIYRNGFLWAGVDILGGARLQPVSLGVS